MNTKPRKPAAILASAAATILLVACGSDGQLDAPVAPTTADVEELESSESADVNVEELEPSKSADTDVEAIDFDAIHDANSALYSLLLRVEESQGATLDALLTQAEDDLNALTDMSLSAIDVSVANLDFEQLYEANGAVYILLLRVEEAKEFFDVAPTVDRVIEGLDQAGAALVATGSKSHSDDVNSAIYLLNLRIDEAEELLSPNTQK